MSFKFKARVLLELGAELISSDAVALYELIKNALDAGSKEVEIRIRIAMQHSAYTQLRTLLQQHIREARTRRSAAAAFDSAEFHAMVLQQLRQLQVHRLQFSRSWMPNSTPPDVPLLGAQPPELGL